MLEGAARIGFMAVLLAAGSLWLRPGQGNPAETSVHFVDRAQQSGCANKHSMVNLSERFQNIMPWLSSVGAATAAADYDGDGHADLYITMSGRGDSDRLLHNRGDGTFEDVTAQAGVGCGNPSGASMHAIWGDVDNDGDLDLYVVKWAEPNQLFRNDGDGHFSDISAAAGVDYWGYGNGATFFDYDRDGHVDILVGNYFPNMIRDPASGEIVRNDLWRPVTTRVMHETFTHAKNGARNVLYHNRGDGTFEDTTDAAGLGYTGWTLAVGAGDLNNDGWPDLYLANDFGPDEFYLSTGATEFPPRFRLIVDPRGHPGIGTDWWKGMNVDMGDVNNDGYLDIYVTNVFERNYKTDEGNMLWINTVDPLFPGGRGFRNDGAVDDVYDGGWGWCGKFADFNNDGRLDIFTVNGFVTGDLDHNYWYQLQEMVTQTKNNTADAADWPVMGTRDLSGHQPSKLYMQSSKSNKKAPGALTFKESAIESGIRDEYNGRGIAVADFNNDGYLDMYIANQGQPACYYVNDTGRHNVGPAGGSAYLHLTLVGAPAAGVQVAGRTLASTADAVGARVLLYGAGGLQMREVQGGMGFASQSEYALHFGVPAPDKIERMVVQWPSSRTREFDAAATKALLRKSVVIREDASEVVVR